MEVGDAEAQLGVDSKAAVGCEDADAGWLEGVVGREHELAVVQPTLKVGAFRTLQHKVPLQQVVWQRVCLDVGHGLLHAWQQGAGQATGSSGSSVRGGEEERELWRTMHAATAMHGCGGARKLTLSSPLYSFCSRVTQPFCADAMLLLLLSACLGVARRETLLLGCQRCSDGWVDVGYTLS